MELSKRDKATAREIIETGLEKEFENALSGAETILNEWKSRPANNGDAYRRLYKHIATFDKRIARRYDRMTGSTYLLIIIAQLQDGLISEGDLENFSEEVKQRIKLFLTLN